MGICLLGGIAAFFFDSAHCELLWKNIAPIILPVLAFLAGQNSRR
ncbi:MAG: hypothetical protein QOE70_5966 [Chthoniobacter sp.]|jgi:hypothetical protein|nr:hypothetical protein [Chthoniobacter sp.]